MGKIKEALNKSSITDLEATKFDEIHEGPTTEKDRDYTKQKGLDASPKHTINKSSKFILDKNFQKGPIDFRVIVYHNPESIAAEHFKVLRGRILHCQDGKKIKSVLITSALDQEGKTMVACNLAVSIAQSLDPYVLLIDADIRRPNVHNMLGLKKAQGLSDYLEFDLPLSKCLIKGPLDKMRVLQAGSTVRNPAELLTSEKTKNLLEEVRQRYEDRFIVIDSPPINLAAETGVLAQQVDAVIIVVKYGVSDKNAVEEALSKLDKNKILGIVFNAFEVTPRKYTYYKKYYAS